MWPRARLGSIREPITASRPGPGSIAIPHLQPPERPHRQRIGVPGRQADGAVGCRHSPVRVGPGG